MLQDTKHIIDISKLTTFYMASDGYQDQFGGKDNRKFMRKNFKELLYQISKESFEEQKKILSNKLNEWIGEVNQVDDILVVEIKASNIYILGTIQRAKAAKLIKNYDFKLLIINDLIFTKEYFN